MYFFVDKIYTRDDNIGAVVQTDTISVETSSDSIELQPNKQDSIIRKLEEDIMLLKSVLESKKANAIHR